MSQLVLYCAPTGEDPKQINPLVALDKGDLMHKYYELNNRKAFKVTDYTILYSVLPFSLFDSDENDLRYREKGSRRFLEIFITDSRIRSWRSMYLKHLQNLEKLKLGEKINSSSTSSNSNSNLNSNSNNNLNELNEDENKNDNKNDNKKRKTNNNGNISSGTNILDQYEWPENLNNENMPLEFIVQNKVKNVVYNFLFFFNPFFSFLFFLFIFSFHFFCALPFVPFVLFFVTSFTYFLFIVLFQHHIWNLHPRSTWKQWQENVLHPSSKN